MSRASGFGGAVIYGAGAVGSYLGARLSTVVPTSLVARGPHARAIASDGLRLTGTLDQTHRLPVVDSVAEAQPGLLLVVAVKMHALEEAAEDIAARAPTDCTVLCVQNGLDPTGAVRSVLSARGRSDIVVARAITGAACNRTAPGEVEYWGGGLTFPRDAELTPVADLFARAGVPVERVDAILDEEWKKLAVNCVANPLSALGRGRNRDVVTPELAPLRRSIVDEVRACALRRGVVLPPDLPARIDRALAESNNRNSMLQDIVYGRRTEIMWLNGLVDRIARQDGSDAPTNRTLTRLVRFLERRHLSSTQG